jgi:hypothetical protein
LPLASSLAGFPFERQDQMNEQQKGREYKRSKAHRNGQCQYR